MWNTSLEVALLSVLLCAGSLCLADHPTGSRASRQLISADIPSKCGQETFYDKLVVAARYKENVSWMPAQLQVPYLVYQAERRGLQGMVPHKHSNSAREASAFLTFIAEYYDCLPEITAFVHGHDKSWHSNVPDDLRNLKWEAVGSYLPLSRKYFYSYGSFFWMYTEDPNRHLKVPIATGDEARNGSFPPYDILNGTVYVQNNTMHYRQAKDVAQAWENFFEPAGLGPLPKEIRYYCCAQFAVRKEQIMRLPREFYLKAIYWLDNSDYKGNARYTRGLIMETLWHIIMGEAPVLETPKGRECQIYHCDQAKTATSH